MKTVLLSLYALINMSIINTHTIPKVIIAIFEREHAGVFQTWKIEDKYYRVEYVERHDNSRRAILFADDGRILRRDKKESDNYPKQIARYVSAVYPGEHCDVWSSYTGRSEVNYYIIRPTGKIWFDRHGKVLSCSL